MNFYDMCLSADHPYIRYYGGDHLFMLAVLAVIVVALIRMAPSARQQREKICRWLLGIQIAQQCLLYSWYVFCTGFDLAEALPFHLSRITSLLILIWLFTRRAPLLQYIFFFGLYAYPTFFWPTAVYPLYHALGLSFFINHIVTIALPIFVGIAYDYRPTVAGLHKTFLCFCVYLLVIDVFNEAFGYNYFYTEARPFAFLNSLPDPIFYAMVLGVTYGVFWLAYGIYNRAFGPRRAQNTTLQAAGSGS